jgi:putative nucleotidyltransferase with HDIG domain
MKKNILIVDDDIYLRQMLGATLKSLNYSFMEAGSVQECMDSIEDLYPDLVLMDINLGAEDGFAALEKIKSLPKGNKIPVLMITATGNQENYKKALFAGAEGFLPKPFQLPVLIDTLSRWSNAKVEEGWKKLDSNQEKVLTLTLATMQKVFSASESNQLLPYDEVKETCDFMTRIVSEEEIRTTLDSIKDHDSYTFVHSLRVAIYLVIFARYKGFSKEKISIVAQGGLLHDVGKIFTPVQVLNKPGRLDNVEWEIMREHVDRTVEILSRIPDLPHEIIEIAGNHHEKIAGNGYPRGVSGDKLSELSKMAAIVDAYVALTDRRVYKPGHPPEEALEMLRNPPGHLDIKLIEEFKVSIVTLDKLSPTLI